MESPVQALERLLALERSEGEHGRCLRVGPWELILEGLEAELAALLDLRWGGFVGGELAAEPALRLRIFEAGHGLSPGRWAPGESYRIDGKVTQGRLLVRSYHFALCCEREDPSVWRVGMIRTADEPPDRILENAVRYLAARLAVKEGGVAIHGAGVLRDGRAYVFAGPSRSGKTTAVKLSAPSTSLGDDFAVLFPREEGWWTAAVPFDNSGEAPADPPSASFPLAGAWRLYHAAEPRVETLPPAQAAASLMGCVAFPWAMPDLTDEVLGHVKRFIGESTFGHLYFRKKPDFWRLLQT